MPSCSVKQEGKEERQDIEKRESKGKEVRRWREIHEEESTECIRKGRNKIVTSNSSGVPLNAHHVKLSFSSLMRLIILKECLDE